MVQFTATRPIFVQISELIGVRIMTGAYPPGSKLASVRDLATELGVNPNTVQRALVDLEAQGLITTHRTIGRTVTEDESAIADGRQLLVKQRVQDFVESLRPFNYRPDDLCDILRTCMKEEEAT
ncbi:MAG: GntR family transcriptional regulator [Actinomycetia bacterium]|nr:GntR family transcriptional regulator [Actinomycetes bacterium]